MDVVGARGTQAAPGNVAAVCSGVGMKDICVTGNCSVITGTPAGGTTAVRAEEVYLVD